MTPSVAQEMWRAFAGGAEEGKPVALNIGMVGRFKAAPQAVTAAIRQVIATYAPSPCSFMVMGINILPGCALTANTAEMVE